MFSRRKALEKLTAISEASAKKAASEGSSIWVPEYHSLSAIESFNSHFKVLTERAERDNGYVDDLLGFDELTWINNEYNICACDYRYWSDNYAFINAEAEIKRFKRRASQSMLLDMWAEREEAGMSIEQQILKARQQGISTEVEMAITHKVNFGMGVKAAIASYDSDACERMGGMMQLAFNKMPSWMRSTPSSDRAGSLMAFAENDTRMTMYSGKKASGIARGDTPSVIHISEVCEFKDAATVIENSLFNAVHPSPRVFMILESTGNGNTDWWARTWYSSRDYWASGGARLQPVFFPWFIASDIFPTVTERMQRPLPKGWSPISETRRMMDKAASYVHNTPMIRKILGEDWRMPDWQAYFWEYKLLEARRKGNENGWYQEMPMDDIEALRPTKDLVFDYDSVKKQEDERPAYSAWMITGEQIQEKFHPDPLDIDYDKEWFTVTYDGHVHDKKGRHNKTFEWDFIPLKQPVEQGVDIFNADLKILISEWPEPGYDYGIGVDNSSGHGGKSDSTVICVNRKSINTDEPDRQVAEVSSNRLQPALTHPWVMALAALYKSEMPPGKEPLVGIEQIYNLGEATQIQMLAMGYKRMYKFSRLDGKNPEADKKKSNKLGWYTTGWSRNFMLTLYKAAIENGWYKLFSPHLIKNEIPSFQIDQTDTGKTRFDHEEGKHDDRIFGSAIAYVIMNDTESLTRRVSSKFERDEEEDDTDYGFPLGYNASYDQVAEELDL